VPPFDGRYTPIRRRRSCDAGDASHERRPTAELFTADQAAPVFMHYVEHQTVPDGYTLRLIADM